ncbi:sugar ABC transporter permease [Deinococcus radiopugnans]|uniref:Sugar ABC transporter permease n=2 Tax=Deinococcus radiopugnans TaxID=57497 RepID=A0A0A7KI46_9DEIO|nr:ABC transporter permease [Deinococcus radiopugnans]AIZ45780.1 sugar ABC transporter permease [Deinococcus radiopugnans]MBB6015758.1 simple sugar transport system permease protein [Deinococcus radiopugnans ATCC 19172]QLG11563.1 ABC transporter permease [Deinococcus sp. D7000]TNM72558.1 ABC transporter permease [Deinococcus radiopugnans ATCC 19172]
MDGLFAQLLTAAFLATFIRSLVPLLLTALGGLFSERSGVVNIALDGLIIFGALGGAVTTLVLQPTLGAAAPWVGWVGGAVIGGLIAWIHAVVSIKYRADQVISGTAINLLATGVPPVILTALYDSSTESPKVANALPLWGIGELRFSPPVYFAFLAVAVTWYVLYRTPFGLRLRATGEQPGAAASMGINVKRMRYTAVILSGVLAGTAGVFLSIGNLDSYVRNISAGGGFIALAALIFGQWKPLGVLGATVLFGFLQALSIALGGGDLLPPTLVQALPYLITILALIFTGRSRAPKALGKPYDG